jgi:hypothetical protein
VRKKLTEKKPQSPSFNNSGNLAFDPDEFKINKRTILRFMDAIEKRWASGTIAKMKNAQYIIGLEAMKVGIRVTDEETISLIWHDIITGFNELIALNQMYRLKGEFPDYDKLVDITLDRIEKGEILQIKK